MFQDRILQHTLYQYVLKIWKQPCLSTERRLKLKSDCDKQYVDTSYPKAARSYYSLVQAFKKHKILFFTYFIIS